MNKELLSKISEKIKKDISDVVAYRDYLRMCKQEHPVPVVELKWLSDACEKAIGKLFKTNIEAAQKLIDIHKDTLRTLAPVDFDSYCLYIEWDREPEKRFYKPRRKVLGRVAREMQRLADGELSLLTISLPPGVGKSTLALFFLTWIAGRYPDEPMLVGSHSNAFVRGAYDECLRIMETHGEYLWTDVFGLNVTSTNAKDLFINLGKPKRFTTFEFTSVGSGNAGLYRARRLLYCDDLVSGIEVALSRERLDKLWEVYTTDLRQRKQGDHCGELHIATRWSVHDVIGRLEEMYSGRDDAEFITIPALDENDNSNFNYPYSLGYDTDTLHAQRDIMDDASWRALYMNQPIEREGLVYPEDELRRYFELPLGDPDSIVGICDTKDKGADYAFLPVAYVYGDEYYIDDCICDNNLPEIVDARLTDILLRHKVKQCQFESNSAGGRVAQKVQDDVKARGGITHITTRYTTANKETKIITNSAWVKEHCLFRDGSTFKRNSDYGRMLNFLCSYTMMGKNKHDDVPDGMAMLAEYCQNLNGSKIKIFDRPF